jgi:flagellar biosynthesis/type III secretory pathway protein FliH
MNASRGGYTRGQRPARPGDLAAKTAERQRREKKAVAEAESAEVREARRTGYSDGWDAGFDRGWDAGYGAALQQFRDSGLDVDTVLALDDSAEGE